MISLVGGLWSRLGSGLWGRTRRRYRRDGRIRTTDALVGANVLWVVHSTFTVQKCSRLAERASVGTRHMFTSSKPILPIIGKVETIMWINALAAVAVPDRLPRAEGHDALGRNIRGGCGGWIRPIWVPPRWPSEFTSLILAAEHGAAVLIDLLRDNGRSDKGNNDEKFADVLHGGLDGAIRFLFLNCELNDHFIVLVNTFHRVEGIYFFICRCQIPIEGHWNGSENTHKNFFITFPLVVVRHTFGRSWSTASDDPRSRNVIKVWSLQQLLNTNHFIIDLKENEFADR